MRAGIIIRSTARGLATQTQEAWRGFPFEAALHIVDGDPVWPEDLWEPHRPDDIYRAHLKDGELLRYEYEEFLSRIDVLFSVETLYSWHFARAVENANVRAVVQGNCELWGPFQPALPMTQWVWPTPWRLDGVPEGPTIPVPVADACRAKAADIDAPLVIVHPAGHAAIGDRNGTELLLRAASILKTEVTLRIIGQDGRGSINKGFHLRVPPNVKVEVIETGVKDRWSLYDGAHAVILPRRYGGLSLPAQEALQAGVIPIMTDCEPNRFWPIIPIPAAKGRGQRVRYGHIETWVADPRMIARRIDELNYDRQTLVTQREAARTWVQEHTWEKMAPMYDELFLSQL
ncbi:MAG: glycosyltransferase protein [Thermomicrobiales bacterium]|jgi:glycosyltransferase involved in cell wall biosynthesis|nr:glycosyltransferase protein [Thermomicrobiales bacterium]MDF3014810.1 glycosyltransferase protein [Thermomicrobiales bacterium]